MSENEENKVNIADMVPERFMVSTGVAMRVLMYVMIFIDIAVVGLAFWLAFCHEELKQVFAEYSVYGWSAMALIVLTAIGGVYYAYKEGFTGFITVEGDVLTVHGKSYKREEITDMVRSGRWKGRCTFMAGDKEICTVVDTWENFNLLQRWMRIGK
ncbi:hypothetical protein IJT17_08085 [bacterium]|nr:hypothetical protein [bacterium]